MIVFRSTTEAMAWEKAAKGLDLPGRLIPLPPQIKADCGLAWSATLGDKEVIFKAAGEYDLKYGQILEWRRGAWNGK
ncbi:MAG: DUF3343 domain-containing protein [Firmicutes bacterium]|nr:DUF3343 domain-containing protein [Bacillota bacterium]